jgi:hypothetical protein
MPSGETGHEQPSENWSLGRIAAPTGTVGYFRKRVAPPETPSRHEWRAWLTLHYVAG